MMNEQIIWDRRFEIGVQEIDLQHRYFFDLINRLSIELGQNDNHQYQLDLLRELNAYARFHFISEENMMAKAGYPSLEGHRRHHLTILDKLTAKEWKLHSQPSPEAIGNMVTFLIEWFLTHTTREDKRFAGFLASSGGEKR